MAVLVKQSAYTEGVAYYQRQYSGRGRLCGICFLTVSFPEKNPSSEWTPQTVVLRKASSPRTWPELSGPE
jgi:hypothetical protein